MLGTYRSWMGQRVPALPVIYSQVGGAGRDPCKFPDQLACDG